MYVEMFLCLLFSKTRWVSCKKQDLLTLPEHLRSPQFFRGPCFSFVFSFSCSVCFCRCVSYLFPDLSLSVDFPSSWTALRLTFPYYSLVYILTIFFYLRCLASLVFISKFCFVRLFLLFFCFPNLFNLSIILFNYFHRT